MFTQNHPDGPTYISDSLLRCAAISYAGMLKQAGIIAQYTNRGVSLPHDFLAVSAAEFEEDLHRALSPR